MPTLEVTYEDGMREYEQAVAQGDAELESLGFPSAQRPRKTDGDLADRPNIPSNLSVLSMSELTDMLGYATEWYRYAMETLPTVASEKNAAESARDFAWAKIRKAKEGRVADKDNETRCDIRYINAAVRFETCDYKYRRIKAICDGLLREVETISRAMGGKELENKMEGVGLSNQRRAYRSGEAGAGRTPAGTAQFFKRQRPQQEE
jgi:hypothetical protein